MAPDGRAVIGTDHEAAAIKAAAEAMPGLTREHAIQVATEALELAAPHIRAAERERIIQLAAQEAARLTRAAQEAEDGPLTSLGSQALTRFINRLRDPT